MSDFDRLSELRGLYEITRASMLEAAADKRAPLIARAESLALQIEALSPKAKAGDPVDEIANRRAARGAGTAKSSSRTSKQG